MKLNSLQGLEKVAGATCLVVAREVYDREVAENILAAGREPVVVPGENARGLLDELESRSLFSAHRCVVVRGAERLPAALAQEIARYCERPNPAVQLVMTAASRPHAALCKAVERQGALVDIAQPKPWEQERALAAWLSQEAQARGVQLTAAAELVAKVGVDKGLLVQELEKLMVYADGKAIDAAAVATLAVGMPTEAAWALGSAVLAADTPRAVAIWRDLMGQGVAPLALLATLRSQLHRALILASLSARGASRQEMGRALPQLSDRALYRAQQEAVAYGEPRLQRALLALADLDLKLRSESLPESTAVDHLITRLTS